MPSVKGEGSPDMLAEDIEKIHELKARRIGYDDGRQVSRENGEQSMSSSLFKGNDVTIGVLMTTAIFTVDVLTPSWYDVWVLYLIPLFFMYRSAKRPYLMNC